MQNKKILSIVGALTLILLIGGIFFFISKNSTAPQEAVEPEIEEEVVPTISPEEIGLQLEPREDNKAIKIIIEKPQGLQSVEYELAYEAEGGIPRGAIGQIQIDAGDVIETEYIELGSCSSGKCKYDEGVTSVTVVLKVTKEDGKVYQTEETVALEN